MSGLFLLDLQPGLPMQIGERIIALGTAYNYALDTPFGRLSRGAGANRFWPIHDGLGSERAYVNFQYGDWPLANRNYSPYGDPIGEDTQYYPASYGFTGEWHEPSYDMLHLRARWYNATVGAFTSLDPFEGVWEDPMSINGYSYVHGNPVNHTDPTGNILPILAAALVGALVGAVVGAATGAIFDVGSQMILEGRSWDCVDWESVKRSALEGAVMGAIGGAVGGVLHRAVQFGKIAKRTAWMIGAAYDVGAGTAWDMVAYGRSPSEAFTRNLLTFGIGAAAGAVAGAAFRRLGSVARQVGSAARWVAMRPSNLW